MNKKIFVLYTGGTIGMKHSPQGLTPDTALVHQALQPFSDGLEFDWHVCNPLIDSSAVTLADQQNWLDLIGRNIACYDGFLILHGTDTLAYTANLFALACRNLDKPIVLTGSQWPYTADNSDAPLNLATAVAALQLGVPQVTIAFNGKLYPAVGSSKVSTQTAAGFDNPHFGVLAELSPEGRLSAAPTPQTNGGFHILTINPQAKIFAYPLIPGFSAAHLAHILNHTPTQALILQSYGHGNAPADSAVIEALGNFIRQGGRVLNISQVPQGCAAAVYAQGNALRHAGVITGGKCNLETATALLTLAVSNDWDNHTICQILQQLGLVEAV
ncbi:asparaginase [Neisseria lisongii]|uniref:Asparaginase n=1 Tax=Neisseria lisongii TaxID=2912188 RepID=A0AAW5AIR9_9NEIS|nr:asparaginase [Neisseria lisongii]MCF7529762.1 asparaginase [Neisseria lisongii]